MQASDLVRWFGYQRTKSDACIYVRSEGGHTHYIALYVDDLLIVAIEVEDLAGVLAVVDAFRYTHVQFLLECAVEVRRPWKDLATSAPSRTPASTSAARGGHTHYIALYVDGIG
jgi:hypothetical protein